MLRSLVGKFVKGWPGHIMQIAFNSSAAVNKWFWIWILNHTTQGVTGPSLWSPSLVYYICYTGMHTGTRYDPGTGTTLYLIEVLKWHAQNNTLNDTSENTALLTITPTKISTKWGHFVCEHCPCKLHGGHHCCNHCGVWKFECHAGLRTHKNIKLQVLQVKCMSQQ